MKNFTALYMMPTEGLESWKSKSEDERKEAETNMKAEWDAWLAEHKDSVLNTIGLGKTKRVSAEGAQDTKNGMMLSSYVQAESLDAAAEIFSKHPHLQIPGATIEIMEANPLTGMVCGREPLLYERSRFWHDTQTACGFQASSDCFS